MTERPRRVKDWLHAFCDSESIADWEWGARCALDMLRLLENDSALCDACAPEPQYRDDAPQHNIVLTHLQAVMAAGDQQALEGFCSVLSSFIAVAADGCVPDSSHLARYVEQQAKADAAHEDARFSRFIQAATPATP